MDLSTIAIISSSAGAVGMTVRRIIISLERRGDRKLIRYVFDQSKSPDVLDKYVELWRPKRSAITLRSHLPRNEPESKRLQQVVEEHESRRGGPPQRQRRTKRPSRAYP